MSHRLNKKTLSYSLLLVFWIAAICSAYVLRQDIFDWVALRGYNAPIEISSFATQDTMTRYARKVLYVNHPTLDDKATFARYCPNNGGEQTIVLGCYHSDQAGIYILNVSDPRLDGVEQVTTAHEMLHAAYDRLSSSERQQVDAMLMDYYNNDLHDPRLLATIAAYRQSEPHDVINEMHSIFGTEIANLPNGLEQYYKRYFTNRQQIASYAAQYQAEFTSRQNEVKAYDAQLSSLKAQIDAAEADLKNRQLQINSQQTRLEDLRGSDPNAYNSAVPTYNNMVNAYNSEAQTLQSQISSYNQIVAARNAVAVEEDELVNDLNSSVRPIQ